MKSQSGVHDRVVTALLETAAKVLAERGPAAGMTDVASAAGVSRATLYRYFPTREDLLSAIGASAIEETERLLREAELDAVDVQEALARMTRTLIAAASKFAILASDVMPVDMDEIRSRLGAPARSVLLRGKQDGTLRQDLSAEELFMIYGGMLKVAMRAVLHGALGLERASSAVVSVFLYGAKRATSGS